MRSIQWSGPALVGLVAAAAFALFVSELKVGVTPAAAFPSGIAGASGAGDLGDGGGITCSICHSVAGDFEPTVSIDGPIELEAGASGAYEILLVDATATAVRGGFNLATAEGDLTSSDAGVSVEGGLNDGELTHNGTRDFEDGEIIWDFDWEAPTVAGDYTFYIAAVAGNNGDGNMQDNVAVATFDVTVTAAESTFIRGDIDGNGVFFPILDALYLLEFGFTGGPAPACEAAADADANDVVFPILDALYILDFGFTGGPAPSTPFPDCGTDPSGVLSCDMSTCTP